MTWYLTFDSVFFITISATLVGCLAMTCKYCYKIKIEDLSCCNNCVSIKRDIKRESMIDLERNSTPRDIIPSPTRSASTESYLRPQNLI
jgi:hypothetical protein